MISTWTIAPTGGETCGFCGVRVPAGQPIELLNRPKPNQLGRALVRCEAHAHSAPNELQIDAARHAEEVRQLSHPVESELTLSNARPTRVPRKRPLTGFTKLGDAGFDPRAAQANDTD